MKENPIRMQAMGRRAIVKLRSKWYARAASLTDWWMDGWLCRENREKEERDGDGQKCFTKYQPKATASWNEMRDEIKSKCSFLASSIWSNSNSRSRGLLHRLVVQQPSSPSLHPSMADRERCVCVKANRASWNKRTYERTSRKYCLTCSFARPPRIVWIDHGTRTGRDCACSTSIVLFDYYSSIFHLSSPLLHISNACSPGRPPACLHVLHWWTDERAIM